MPRQFKVAAISDLPPGEMKLLSLAGVSLALFHLDGRYCAIRNRCPHEGGPVDDRYFLLRRQALQGESSQDEPHTTTKRPLPPKSTLRIIGLII